MKKLITLLLVLLPILVISQIPGRFINGSGSSFTEITTLAELQSLTQGEHVKISSNIDLGGATIDIPSKVLLKWDGGIISNGTLRNTSTIINDRPFVEGPANEQFFGTDLVLEGIRADEIYPEWFGAIGNNTPVTDNRLALQKAFDFGANNGKVVIKGGDYYFSVDDLSLDTYTGSLNIHSNTVIDIINGSGLLVIPNSFTQYLGISFTEADNASLISSDRTGYIKGDFIGTKLLNPVETGHLILSTWRCTNILMDGLDISQAYGDGFKNIKYDGYYSVAKTWESGTINRFTGVLEASSNEIRESTRWDLTWTRDFAWYDRNPDSDFKRHNELHVNGGAYGGLAGLHNGLFDIFFWDANGDFIESQLDREIYDRIKIPVNATECAMVTKKSDPTGVDPVIKAQEITVGLTIRNCHFHDNSRNNISITGAQHVRIYNNLFETSKYGTLPWANIDVEDYHDGNKNGEIWGNTFTEGGNYDLVFIRSWKWHVHDNIFTGQTRASQLAMVATTTTRQIKISNNLFGTGTVYISANTDWTDNTFDRTKIIAEYGILRGSEMINLYMDVKAQDGHVIIEDNIMKDCDMDTRLSANKIEIKNHRMLGETSTMEIYGTTNDVIDGLYTNGNINVRTPKLDNLNAGGLVSIWYYPADNETVEYNNWKLNGDDVNVLFRTSDRSLSHFRFNNLKMNTKRIGSTNYAFDINNDLGSLTFKNSRIIDTTATSGTLINFDNTVTKFRMIESEVETGTGVNLLSIGTSTETSDWLYMGNIFKGVNLNNTSGTEINNFEE